jgi:hypothetical protein
MDPIGFAAGDVNWYRYLGNNSANTLDPIGLRPNGEPLLTREEQQFFRTVSENEAKRLESIRLNQPPVKGAIVWNDSWVYPCPATLDELTSLRKNLGKDSQLQIWPDPKWVTDKFHAGADVTWRIRIKGNPASNQCGYCNGKLITAGTGAGTVDASTNPLFHFFLDVLPWYLTRLIDDYHKLRPPISDPTALPNRVDVIRPPLTPQQADSIDRSLPGSGLKFGSKN